MLQTRTIIAVPALCLLGLSALAPLARAQTPATAGPVPPTTPAPYWSATALRADVGAGSANPFAWPTPEAAADRPAPPRPSGPVPANVAHLSLRKPYSLAVEASVGDAVPEGWARLAPATETAPDGRAVLRLTVPVRNPFDPTAPIPAAPPPVSKEAAADTYQVWLVTVEGSAWDALEAAWGKDAVAVRALFRAATGQDWPVTTTTGPRAEAARLAAARWVRTTWAVAVRQAVANTRRVLGLRGLVLVTGPADAPPSAPAPADAINGFSPALAPRVTSDAVVNRYGVGFVTRLAADLGQRIPMPLLDLSALAEHDAGWGVHWLDEAVRNGVQGVSIAPPRDAVARARVLREMQRLRVSNIYLPPPSEVGILVSCDTATLEPGAWPSVFHAYTALRSHGVWPDFISDEQIASGAVALARFRLLIVPAAKWADRDVLRQVTAWTEGGGALLVSDPNAFSRAEDGWDTATKAHALLGWASLAPPEAEGSAWRVVPASGSRILERRSDGAPILTERTTGLGRVLALSVPLAPGAALHEGFWRGLLGAAGIPARPWRESVTAASVATVSGTYVRP